MITALWVVVAGGAGVLARYLIGTAVATDALPAATVAINAAGAFALGLLLPLGDRLPDDLRIALAVGLLGGFTTFSTFAADVFVDVEAGRGGEALVYLAASVMLGVGGVAAGYFLGRALVH
jgi:CrcB protein